MFPTRGSWAHKLFPPGDSKVSLTPATLYVSACTATGKGGEGATAQGMGWSTSKPPPVQLFFSASSHHITSTHSSATPAEASCRIQNSSSNAQGTQSASASTAASTPKDTPVDPPRCGPASASASVPGRVWCPGSLAPATGAQPSLSSSSKTGGMSNRDKSLTPNLVYFASSAMCECLIAVRLQGGEFLLCSSCSLSVIYLYAACRR